MDFLNSIVKEQGITEIIMGYKNDLEEKENMFFNRRQLKCFYKKYDGDVELSEMEEDDVLKTVISYVSINKNYLNGIKRTIRPSTRLSLMTKVMYELEDGCDYIKDNEYRKYSDITKDLILVCFDLKNFDHITCLKNKLDMFIVESFVNIRYSLEKNVEWRIFKGFNLCKRISGVYKMLFNKNENFYNFMNVKCVNSYIVKYFEFDDLVNMY